MRALTASVVLYNFLKICDRLIPNDNMPSNYTIDLLLCHIWRSHYLSVAIHTFTALLLNFTVGNRAIQIVLRYQHSYSSSRIADLAYLGVLAVVSLVFMLPQAYKTHLDTEGCRCHDEYVPYIELVAVYTKTFVRFGLTAIISTIILGISCYKVIFWVQTSPAEQLSDTWNSLAFASSTKDQRQAFSQPKGWMTASLCIVPFSVNFLLISIYDTGYKF
ncbi:unnamed protein product, partial [Dibothriocephalus latus]